MKTAPMIRGSILRLLVVVQAVLLVPPLLLGSICLKEGNATLEPVSCPCLWSASSSPSSGMQIEQDCGPCRDVTLSALVSRVQLSAPLDGLLLIPSSPQPVANAFLPDAGSPERTGIPPERSFSVLRC